jgi:hypothetical protein
VQIDRFAVNGAAVPWQGNPGLFTWQPVRLPAPLLPHDSVRLSFDWHYEISREAGREGMLNETTWYLAYFYPRVAVYDDYNGWDRMDFTDTQEFYSDFNDYDVTIRVPANFIVWGTGTLLSPESVLQPEALRRYQASFTSDTTVHVATTEDVAAHRVTLPKTNDWHFRARDIPDMAFGVSDRYRWDAASVLVDDAAHRRASVQAAYTDSAADFHHMVQFGRHALDWLSHNWPGVPYPYEKSTIFLGTADMEYPMMVNDNSFPDTSFSRFVAEHEIAHTYMPFYMGINETRYGFMDEGWATTFEYLVGVADMGKARETEFYRQFRVNGWAGDPSPLEDIPIITPGDVLKGAAYGPLAREAPHPLGLLQHLRQRDGAQPGLVLERLVLRQRLHRPGRGERDARRRRLRGGAEQRGRDARAGGPAAGLRRREHRDPPPDARPLAGEPAAGHGHGVDGKGAPHGGAGRRDLRGRQPGGQPLGGRRQHVALTSNRENAGEAPCLPSVFALQTQPLPWRGTPGKRTAPTVSRAAPPRRAPPRRSPRPGRRGGRGGRRRR